MEVGVCECSGSDRAVKRKAQAFAADCGESMRIESKQACNQPSSSIRRERFHHVMLASPPFRTQLLRNNDTTHKFSRILKCGALRLKHLRFRRRLALFPGKHAHRIGRANSQIANHSPATSIRALIALTFVMLALCVIAYNAHSDCGTASNLRNNASRSRNRFPFRARQISEAWLEVVVTRVIFYRKLPSGLIQS